MLLCQAGKLLGGLRLPPAAGAQQEPGCCSARSQPGRHLRHPLKCSVPAENRTPGNAGQRGDGPPHGGWRASLGPLQPESPGRAAARPVTGTISWTFSLLLRREAGTVAGGQGSRMGLVSLIRRNTHNPTAFVVPALRRLYFCDGPTCVTPLLAP